MCLEKRPKFLLQRLLGDFTDVINNAISEGLFIIRFADLYGEKSY
jgi:hypothetical protein